MAARLKQRKRIVTLGKKIKIERQQNLKNQIQQNIKLKDKANSRKGKYSSSSNSSSDDSHSQGEHSSSGFDRFLRFL